MPQITKVAIGTYRYIFDDKVSALLFISIQKVNLKTVKVARIEYLPGLKVEVF